MKPLWFIVLDLSISNQIIKASNVIAHGPPVWAVVMADHDHQLQFTAAHPRHRRSHAAGVMLNVDLLN